MAAPKAERTVLLGVMLMLEVPWSWGESRAHVTRTVSRGAAAPRPLLTPPYGAEASPRLCSSAGRAQLQAGPQPTTLLCRAILPCLLWQGRGG